MLTGLAALAILGFLLSQKGGAAGAGGDPAVNDDLKKLYQANPQAYQAVVALLGGGNPAKMIQYAAQLNQLYPALAKKLGDMAAASVTPVTGASGTSWNLWGKSEGNTAYVDVLLGAMPVISYSQVGQDKSTRKFLGAAAGVDSATVARARADFNVA